MPATSLWSQHASNGDDSNKKKPNRLDGPYRNLRDRDSDLAISGQESEDLELFPTQAIKTHVVAGPLNDYDDDRIHLRVDLEQG